MDMCCGSSAVGNLYDCVPLKTLGIVDVRRSVVGPQEADDDTVRVATLDRSSLVFM